MRRLFLIAATLGLCVFALMGCRNKPAFDAGASLSAEELEALRISLQEKEKEEGPSGENTPDPTPENGGGNDDEQESSPGGELEENKTVVYYTVSGEVYHSDRDCSYLKKSTNVIEGSVVQAAESGKTRHCGTCAKGAQNDAATESDGDGAGDQTSNSGGESGENKTVVYYTEGGETYHFDENCSYLKNSELVNEGMVDDALAAGKNRPCSRCGD